MNLKPEIRRHLEGLGCTLWGRAFDIKNEDADAAIEWLNEEIEAILGPHIEAVYEDYRIMLERWKEEQKKRITAEAAYNTLYEDWMARKTKRR